MLNIMVSSLVERQAVEPEGALGCEARVTQLKNMQIQKREVLKYTNTKTRSENDTNIKTITKYANTKKSLVF